VKGHNLGGIPCRKCGKIHKDHIGANNPRYKGLTKADKAAYKKQYRKLNKEKLKSYNREYRINNKEKVSNYGKKHYLKLKVKIFEILGGVKCSICGFDADVRALQIHHKGGGGSKEYREKNNFSVYMSIIKKPELSKEKYQIVCANCNFILRKTKGNSRSSLLQKEAVLKLGGRCVRCGLEDVSVLQIDHINGGGRKEFNSTSPKAYYRRIIETPDKNKYQVLCANCNSIKKHEDMKRVK